jgi:site-specific recombinase XerD
MTARHFAEKVQTDYIRYVRNFAAFLGRSPDTASAEDLRLFQLHMTKTHVSPGVINATVVALRFFFKVTLERDDLVRRLTLVSEPRRVPIVLSPEEVARLLTAAPGVKYKAALGVAYGAGLRVSEVVALKVSDIDNERRLLRVEQGKGRKDRFVMLSPQLLELLRDWWQVARPRGWLFPGLDPVNPMSARQLRRAVSAAARTAGIAKRVSPYTLRAQLRHPSARTERRYQGHPGSARTRQARNDRALHARRPQHDPRRDESAGAARSEPGQDPGEKRRRARSARLTPASRGASGPGGRGHLPRPWPGLA